MEKYDFKASVYVLKLFPKTGKYYYKIGISNNVKRRVRQLKRQYKVAHIEIIWVSPLLSEATARRVENDLLKKISGTNQMVRKECFYAEEPLELTIKIRKEYHIREELTEIEIDC